MYLLITESWNNFINSGDKRANQLPLIRDPTIAICATIGYLVMVKVGPRLMEKREAWELRKLLIGYNFCCVLLSIWMMWEFFAGSFLNPRFNFYYEDWVQTDTSYNTMRLVNAHWLYFISKLIEFLDTFFFILRKKNNQISFLHVYHHASMVLLTWVMVKFTPGAAAYLGPLCNSFIHTVMYTYYMLSAFGPHMQKYLWWKRYLTRMQLTQFLIILLYCAFLISLNLQWVYCFIAWLQFSYLITLMILFANFYVKAYRTVKKSN